jgi:hypothetical protein
MADDDLQVLTIARRVLIKMRQNWATTIAAGYERGTTENAIEEIIEVQQAIDVIDRAIEELEEAELEEAEGEDE